MLWQADEIAELQVEEIVEQATSLRERVTTTGSRAYTSRSERAWDWAMSMVYSRSLVVEATDGSNFRALVPFLDMFNHKPESPVEYSARWSEGLVDDEQPPESPWRFTADAKHIDLHAEASVGRGEEVTIPCAPRAPDPRAALCT